MHEKLLIKLAENIEASDEFEFSSKYHDIIAHAVELFDIKGNTQISQHIAVMRHLDLEQSQCSHLSFAIGRSNMRGITREEAGFVIRELARTGQVDWAAAEKKFKVQA